MVKLVKYDALRHALAAASRTDEVMKIKRLADKKASYARIAEDKDALGNWTRLRMRALQRLGQLMEKQKKTGGLAKGVVGKPGPGRGKRGVRVTPRFDDPPTYADAGIDKNLAKAARKWASASDEEIEQQVEMVVDPSKRPPPKRRKVQVHDVVVVDAEGNVLGQRDALLFDINITIQTAKRCSEAHPDDLIVTAARRAAKAWAKCVEQLEGHHAREEA